MDRAKRFGREPGLDIAESWLFQFLGAFARSGKSGDANRDAHFSAEISRSRSDPRYFGANRGERGIGGSPQRNRDRNGTSFRVGPDGKGIYVHGPVTRTGR